MVDKIGRLEEEVSIERLLGWGREIFTSGEFSNEDKKELMKTISDIYGRKLKGRLPDEGGQKMEGGGAKKTEGGLVTIDPGMSAVLDGDWFL